MTVIDELTDLALQLCETARQSDGPTPVHSRGATLLSVNGKVYTGADVYPPQQGLSQTGGGGPTNMSMSMTNNSFMQTNRSFDGNLTGAVPVVSAERVALLAALSDGSNHYQVCQYLLLPWCIVGCYIMISAISEISVKELCVLGYGHCF